MEEGLALMTAYIITGQVTQGPQDKSLHLVSTYLHSL